MPRWPKNPYHAQLARHLGRWGVAVAGESRLKTIARAAHPANIVHLHALPAFRLLPAPLARFAAFWVRLWRLRHKGVKLVWTVHNLADHESTYPAIDRLFLRAFYWRADAVILHSLGARHLVESQWQVQRERGVYIVHHGHFVDCYPAAMDRDTARRRLGIPPDELVFLFLGSIRRYKGVPELVRAFKAVAGPRMRLVIAGETLSEKIEREIVREIGGDPAITFHPRFVGDADLPAYFGCADAVVLPYTKTLTSGALILAMSFGCACIAPDMGALSDTLDTEGGFLFPPMAAGGLKQALTKAIERRADLAGMGRHNLTRVRQWGWDDAAALTAAAYKACLSEIR